MIGFELGNESPMERSLLELPVIQSKAIGLLVLDFFPRGPHEPVVSQS